MKKRILSVLIALTMVLTLMPGVVFAEDIDITVEVASFEGLKTELFNNWTGEKTIVITESFNINQGLKIYNNQNVVLRSKEGSTFTLTRSSGFTAGNEDMIDVGNNNADNVCSLTLENIILDGGANWSNGAGSTNNGIYRENSSILSVRKSATVNLNNGAVLCNNEKGGGGAAVWLVGTMFIKGGEIRDNATKGSGKNGGAIVVRNSYSKLTMNSGVISGNYATGAGGAVYIQDGGSFTMAGGLISENSANGQGGAIHIINKGSFKMTGGTISENHAADYGGAVFIQKNCSFTMGDSTNTKDNCIISNNRAADGGAVFVQGGGNFTLNNGIITENSNAEGKSGGAVFVNDTDGNGIFTMNGGEISYNKSGNEGGAVYVNGNFTMNDGKICNNEAPGTGGAVQINRGHFVMDGGEISENHSDVNGGAIYAKNYKSENKLTFGGTAKIVNNTAGTEGNETANNLYLASGKNVTLGTKTNDTDGNGVAVPVTKGDNKMSVGVTMQTAGQFIMTPYDAEGVKDCFFSDSFLHKVRFNQTNKYLELTEKTQDELIVEALAGTLNQSVSNVIDVTVDQLGNHTVKLLQDVNLDSENITIAENVTLDLNHFNINTTGTVTNNGTIILHQKNADIVDYLLYNVPGNYGTDEELKLPNDATPDYVIPARTFMTAKVGKTPVAYQELGFTSGENMLVWNKDVPAGMQLDVVYSLKLGGNILSAKTSGIKDTNVTAVNFALNDNISIGSNTAIDGAATLTVKSLYDEDGNHAFDTIATFAANGKKITLNKTGKLVISSDVTGFDEKVLVSGVVGMEITKTEDTTEGTVTYFIETPVPAAGEGYTIDYAAEKITVDGNYEISTKNGAESGETFADGKLTPDGSNQVPATPGTTYYIRKAASGEAPASEAVSFTLGTRQAIPAAPVLVDKTDNTITVEAVAGQEYSIDNGTTWVTDTEGKVVFDNLTANKAYSIVTRVKAITTGGNEKFASANSTAAVITTKNTEKSAAAADPVDVINGEIKSGGKNVEVKGENGGAVASEKLVDVANKINNVLNNDKVENFGKANDDTGIIAATEDNDSSIVAALKATTDDQIARDKVNEADISKYLNVTLVSADVNADIEVKITAMTFDVTPMATITVTGEGGESVTMTTEISNDEIGGNVTFLLPVDFSITAATAAVYHEGEFLGNLEIKVDESGKKYIKVTTNSFSEFGYITLDETTAGAKIDTTLYASFSDAVSAVQNNETITLLKDASGTITVSRNVKFTVNANNMTNTAEIVAGSGYRVNKRDNTYMVSKIYYDASYSVELPTNVKNGKIEVSPKKASAGQTVTLTITPDKGFTLEALTVLDKNGNEIEAKDLGNNKFSFKMPSGKVTIKVTFMEDNSMLNFFVDVKATDYFYDAVLWAAKTGITDGVDATHFVPEIGTTRGQMVTFLWRAVGCPESSIKACPFTDVSEGTYFYEAVLWAFENGITDGTSATTFNPDRNVTRGQAVTFLARLNGVKDNATGYSHNFTDVKNTAYYNNAVAWAFENKISDGTSATTFSPDRDCLRCEIVTYLYRNFVK